MSMQQPRNPEFRSFVENYFAAQRYLGLLGVELARVEPGLVEIVCPTALISANRTAFSTAVSSVASPKA